MTRKLREVGDKIEGYSIWLWISSPSTVRAKLEVVENHYIRSGINRW